MGELLAFEHIRGRIIVVRGQRVMLSGDLAELYGLEPRVLLQAVRRNLSRFPEDFLFRLDWHEAETLAREVARSRSQTVILKRGSNVKYRP